MLYIVLWGIDHCLAVYRLYDIVTYDNNIVYKYIYVFVGWGGFILSMLMGNFKYNR